MGCCGGRLLSVLVEVKDSRRHLATWADLGVVLSDPAGYQDDVRRLGDLARQGDRKNLLIQLWYPHALKL